MQTSAAALNQGHQQTALCRGLYEMRLQHETAANSQRALQQDFFCGGEELVVDDFAYHLEPTAAQQGGRDEIADRQDEDEHAAGGNALAALHQHLRWKAGAVVMNVDDDLAPCPVHMNVDGRRGGGGGRDQGESVGGGDGGAIFSGDE